MVSNICPSCQSSLIKQPYTDIRLAKIVHGKENHWVHYDCLLDEKKQHIHTKGKSKILNCPHQGCQGLNIPLPKGQKVEEVISKQPSIQVINLTNPRPLKLISYLAVAIMVMSVAIAIYPSILSVGIGGAIACPLAYLSGRLIDNILIPKELCSS